LALKLGGEKKIWKKTENIASYSLALFLRQIIFSLGILNQIFSIIEGLE
jgi:hypothetical protein